MGGAAALVLAPLLALLATAVGPLNTGDGFAEMLRVYDAERDAIQAADLLAFAGALLMIPAMLAVARAVRGTAPALALWGACLSVAGWASLIGLIGYDQVMVDVSRDAAVRDQLARSLDSGEAWALPAIFGMFIVGTVVGGVLLGTALVRTRVVPVWAGVAVAAALVVNTVAHVAEVKALSVAAFALLAAGLAALALRALGVTDAQWEAGDLPPVRPAGPAAAVTAGP